MIEEVAQSALRADLYPAPQKPTSIEHLDYMQYLAIQEVCDVLEHPETDFVDFTQRLNWEITKIFIKRGENYATNERS